MFDYDKLSKEDLVEIMEATLANEDLAEVVNNAMEKSRRYGLVWRDHPEDVATRCEEEFPYVKEVKSRHITTLDVFKREDVFDWVTRSDNKIKYHTPHMLFEGDNYHSLSVLNFTHKNKIDVIYIDPPYNTGNEGWKYNDRIIDKEDGFSHSKWLSFMDKRLRLAKPLLKESGIIFISIDDNEQAQLKLLCDNIFGQQNFVANIIWDKRTAKGNTKGVSIKTEYILVYAKNKSIVNGIYIPKPAAVEMLEKAERLSEQNYQKWLSKQDFSQGEKAYKFVDDNGVYRGVSLEAPTNSKNKYGIYHPTTGKVCKAPKNGWRIKEETFNQFNNEDLIIYGRDETIIPNRKYYLEDNMYQSLPSLFEYAGNGIEDLIGLGFNKDDFDYPKPVELIKWLLTPFNKEAKILDFFAGTGTTGHAVLDLNMRDGGDRQFILCTNDENEICTSVCHPRLSKVIHGYTKPNGEKVKGIPANLRYYKCDDNCFITVSGSMDTMKARFNRDAATPMVCIAEGVYDQVDMETESAEVVYRIFNHGDKYLGLFYDTINDEGMTRFANKLRSYEGNKIAYVFTYDDAIDEEILEDDYHELNEIEGLEVKALPVDIINTYKRIFRK